MDAKINNELVLTRIFDAPRAVVWKAWTDPKQVQQWWGPEHFTNPVCEMDVRTGGSLKIVMRSPTGSEHPMKGVFREVVKNERLVFTNIATDENGGTLLEGLTTVIFEDEDGKTKLTLKTSAAGLESQVKFMLQGMTAGWSQSFAKLTILLTTPHGGSHA